VPKEHIQLYSDSGFYIKYGKDEFMASEIFHMLKGNDQQPRLVSNIAKLYRDEDIYRSFARLEVNG
jgi:hypothetical protein